MNRLLLTLSCLMALMTAAMPAIAQTPDGDPNCIALNGVAVEGPVDSLMPRLKAAGYAEWGHSDDGEDYYYRGKFYGLRAKLLVSTDSETRMVRSAYVTVGPYSSKGMLSRNMQYFLYKLQKDHGTFAQRDGAYVYMGDEGSVKLSVVTGDTGSKDIRVLYVPTTAYYKDALSMGLKGDVQEVVTEGAVAEEQFMHFQANGQLENPDLAERQYDAYGYLRQAKALEQEGYSTVNYDYDSRYRLVKRTLKNAASGISYTHEYTYNDEDELLSENQKVYDKNHQCILTINMHYNYLQRDDHGNWTVNQLKLSYWEQGSASQQTAVLQKRTIVYWE